MDLRALGIFLGVIFTVGAVVFAGTVYMAMAQIDDNLVYMALYYEEQAHNLSAENADPDVINYAMKQAVNYCALYSIEKRQIDYNRYREVCSNITQISYLYILGNMTPWIEIHRGNLADARRELWKSRPYMSVVFNPGFSMIRWGFRPGEVAGP